MILTKSQKIFIFDCDFVLRHGRTTVPQLAVKFTLN